MRSLRRASSLLPTSDIFVEENWQQWTSQGQIQEQQRTRHEENIWEKEPGAAGLANQGTSCSARAGSPGCSCLVSFDNYYGMVTNACFSFSHFRMDRFIAMIFSFSTTENLNVLMAENMSWVYWLPAYKEPNLGFLERASLSPRYLRQWIWYSNRKRLKSWPLGEGVRMFYVWKQRCACRIGKPEAEQDRKC